MVIKEKWLDLRPQTVTLPVGMRIYVLRFAHLSLSFNLTASMQFSEICFGNMLIYCWDSIWPLIPKCNFDLSFLKTNYLPFKGVGIWVLCAIHFSFFFCLSVKIHQLCQQSAVRHNFISNPIVAWTSRYNARQSFVWCFIFLRNFINIVSVFLSYGWERICNGRTDCRSNSSMPYEVPSSHKKKSKMSQSIFSFMDPFFRHIRPDDHGWNTVLLSVTGLSFSQTGRSGTKIRRVN